MSSSLVRKIFTDYFPPPAFLQMPAIGLDVSDTFIRCTELIEKNGHYRLGLHTQDAIPADVIEEGYIKNKPEFAKILSTVQKKYNLKYVKFTLPEEKTYLFKTQIPAMSEADIRGALQYKIEENVPIALHDAVYGFRIINFPQKDTQHIDVAVTVIHTKVVNNYLNAFTAAGLIPLELRTEAQAIAHAVVPHDDMSTFVLVALRDTKTIVAIVSRNVVQFTSTLSVGGSSIADALKKQLSVTDADVEDIRRGKVIRSTNDMFESLVSAGSVVRDEVQKLFTYWEGHADPRDSKEIQHIIVSGSDSLLGIDKYLAQSFRVPVSIANAWENIPLHPDEVPPIVYRDSLDFVPSLGLALPYD